MRKRMKKYNNQTRGYKIDIFVNGQYWKSTDWYKRCKDAKKSYTDRHPDTKPETVKAFFDYQN